MASELMKLHKENDINKAMWLLCMQPDCIDGSDLCVSSSLIKWVVGYAKTNGVRSTDQDGADDSWYNVTYEADGYQITINSNEDRDSDMKQIKE